MTGLLVPQTVDRGDGTVYRARKPPEAVPSTETSLCGVSRAILVLRCHDPNLALVAVGDAVLADRISPMLADELIEAYVQPHDPGHVRILSARAIWVRWVPDTYGVPDSPGAWERELRGTAGATPAVLFAHPHTHPKE